MYELCNRLSNADARKKWLRAVFSFPSLVWIIIVILLLFITLLCTQRDLLMLRTPLKDVDDGDMEVDLRCQQQNNF